MELLQAALRDLDVLLAAEAAVARVASFDDRLKRAAIPHEFRLGPVPVPGRAGTRLR